ncbi:MAG: amidase [Pedosphaera sp.]|nr:amidase [Pedosphaera sp.]
MGVLLAFGLRKITVSPDLNGALRWMDLSFTPDQIHQLEDEAQRQKARIQSARERPVDPLRPQTLVFRPWHDSVPSVMPDGFKWQPIQGLKRPLVESDLGWLSVADLAALLRGRLISSETLTRLALERLGSFDARLHCVITRLDERALESARKVDEEIRAGRWRGPLHGIPYEVKDLIDVRGYPSTWGIAIRSNTIAPENATVVRRLDDAGAVLVAKLSLGELAMGDIWFGGKTRNPWSTNEGSSGSSAGSAASVAAGLLPFAIGSETLGSIVSPSTVCGVTGLRPTFGRIPRTGAMMLCPSLDKLGILARSAEDCALVFQVIRGRIDSKRMLPKAR